MKQSKELTAFYKAWLEWAENGAVDSMPFMRGIGLCDNMSTFLYNDVALSNSQVSDFAHEMRQQFRNAELDVHYPFGDSDYTARGWNDTMHLCPVRIQWVKDHIPA